MRTCGRVPEGRQVLLQGLPLEAAAAAHQHHWLTHDAGGERAQEATWDDRGRQRPLSSIHKRRRVGLGSRALPLEAAAERLGVCHVC